MRDPEEHRQAAEVGRLAPQRDAPRDEEERRDGAQVDGHGRAGEYSPSDAPAVVSPRGPRLVRAARSRAHRPRRRRGWAEILAGRDTLIAAPTGSGKTLAAFLASLDALVRSAEAGRARRRRSRSSTSRRSRRSAATCSATSRRRSRASARPRASLGLAPPGDPHRPPHRRHDPGRARGDRPARPAHPHHDPRVALPDAHRRADARAAPRACARSSSTSSTRSCATSAAATSRSRSRASTRSPSSAPAAHRPVGHGAPHRRGGAVPRRRRAARARSSTSGTGAISISPSKSRRRDLRGRRDERAVERDLRPPRGARRASTGRRSSS